MSPTVSVSQNTTREDYNISCYITLVIKKAYDKGRLGFSGRGRGEEGEGESGEGRETGGREGNRMQCCQFSGFVIANGEIIR